MIEVNALPFAGSLADALHHHGDHLDGPTLEWLAAHRPRTRFIVPAGIATEVSRLALPGDRLLWAEADRPLTLAPGFEATPVPAAHETFACDASGHHRFLGYVFRWGPFKLYHSGDSIPYPALAERITARAIASPIRHAQHAFRCRYPSFQIPVLRERAPPDPRFFPSPANSCKRYEAACRSRPPSRLPRQPDATPYRAKPLLIVP